MKKETQFIGSPNFPRRTERGYNQSNIERMFDIPRLTGNEVSINLRFYSTSTGSILVCSVPFFGDFSWQLHAGSLTFFS
ncbi:hypothetical protein NMG60_11030126 [Bertholletia excelsa]